MTEHPPGWHPDPRGRHEHRYWDGTQWTDHVSDGGVASTDPLDAEEVRQEEAPIGPSMVNLPAIDPSLLQQHVSRPAPAEPAPQAEEGPAGAHREQAGPEDALERASDAFDSAAASMAHKPLSLAAILTVAVPGAGHFYLGAEGGRRTKAIALLVATVVAAAVASWISWPVGLAIYLVALGVALADLKPELGPMQERRASGGPLAMFSDLGAGLSWRLTVVGGALLVLSLLLPWYRQSVEGFSASISGFDSFAIIDLILLVIGIGAVVVGVMNVQGSRRPGSDQLAVVMAAAAAAALLLVVFRLLVTPGGLDFGIERSFGALLAFAASVLLLGGAAGAASSKS